MKTYEECVTGILQKTQQRRSVYRKRQKLVGYFGSMAACLLIVAVCASPGVESPVMGTEPPLPEREALPFGPGPEDSGAEEMIPVQETAQDVVLINQLEGKKKTEVLADQEFACDPWSMEQWIAHFGVDMRPDNLPQGLSEYGHTVCIQLDDSGGVLEGRWTITYGEDSRDVRASAGGPAAWLTVSAATGGIPLETDYIWPEDLVTSTLSGIEVTIGVQRISEAYGEYAAFFSAGGLSGSVASQNISQKDFLQILASVLARFSS